MFLLCFNVYYFTRLAIAYDNIPLPAPNYTYMYFYEIKPKLYAFYAIK